MSIRIALLLTASALLGEAPALAQDHADDRAIEWQQYEVVQGDPTEILDEEVYFDSAVHTDVSADMHPHRGREEYVQDVGNERLPEMYYSNAPRLAYSNEEREAWLADCRIVMRGSDGYYEDARYEDEDDNDGLLGGLLGAVIGGVAGNRIGGSGDRLAGTLIGAGVGGIAGAAIGSAVGSDEDDRRYDDRGSARGWASEYCDAYLRRYEASGQAGSGSVQATYAQPVTMMQGPAPRGAMREIVREEWIDVPVEEAESPTRQRAIPRRAVPEQGKLTPIK